MRTPSDFARRYGPWALIAGGSEGIGAEFGRQLAACGLNVLLLARRTEPLAEVAAELRSQHAVQVRTASIDLAAPELREQLREATAGLEVGLLVYNAAHSALGPFLARELPDLLRCVEVNCLGLVTLAHELGRSMAARRRGGIIVMSSLAAGHGSPLIATYAGTKAFDLVFAEGLWEELGREGVDVLSCCAGATRTPAYERSQPRGGEGLVGEPGPVVRASLASLGVRPVVVPGWRNVLASFVLNRLLSRRRAAHLMGAATRSMYDR